VTIDASVISYIVKYDDLLGVQKHGINRDHFVDEWRTVFTYLVRMRRDHDAVPSEDTLQARFPDLEDLPRVRRSELPMFISTIRQRTKYIKFLESLRSASGTTSPEQVDEAIAALQGQLNSLSYEDSQQSHLVDLFSRQGTLKIKKELKRRNSADFVGLQTGFKTFDGVCGGLHKQRMVTVIGRSGIGKSWVDLFFVAKAVTGGAKVMLYPLEMTLFETATRLYTIFTQDMFGPTRALRNLDLTQGRISTAKVARFTSMLEDRFKGQLFVADVSSLADPYTNERIEAEVEIHKPDMFWVDYLTLLKNIGKEEGYESVKKLSNGIKNTSMRRNVIGGASAQVNREALKTKAFLPRLEHIMYGDSIGQDSDQVFSLNKHGGDLYYALVKNRHGPEIGKVKVQFDPDRGVIREYDDQDDDDEDD
jgi:replicative DNA helicase